MFLILQGFNEAYTGSWVMIESGCDDGGHCLHVEGKGRAFVMQELLYWADPRIVSLVKHFRFDHM